MNLSTRSINNTIKRESKTPAPVDKSLATSVVQSLRYFDQATAERKHREALTIIATRCPVLKNLANSFMLPILCRLRPGELGVPLYIAPSGTCDHLRVEVPVELASQVADPHMRGLLTFGGEDARRAMVQSVFKFFLWQCGAIEDLAKVSKKDFELDWLNFPQIVWNNGFRIANIPASALYPNGQPETLPSRYPLDVLDDIVLQFAHREPAKRFGLVHISHDTTAMPFMSKVLRHSDETHTPIEWSIAGSPETRVNSPRHLCRCNLCLSEDLHPGSQLIISMLSDSGAALQTKTLWEERFKSTGHIFTFPDLTRATSRAPSSDRSSTLPLSVIPHGNKDDKETPIPGIMHNGLFVPQINFADLDEGSDSEFEADITGIEEDVTSDASSSYSADPPETCQDPTDASLDIPSIRATEIEWDLEDFETEHQRTLEDEALKRKREEEDRAKEVGRKKRRVTLESEYLIDQMMEQRREEDRRREEARKREDEEMMARMKQRLASIA